VLGKDYVPARQKSIRGDSVSATVFLRVVMRARKENRKVERTSGFQIPAFSEPMMCYTGTGNS